LPDEKIASPNPGNLFTSHSLILQASRQVGNILKISHELYYWTAKNATAEIDFLIQSQNGIIPIEVKAEENLKSKSLKVFL